MNRSVKVKIASLRDFFPDLDGFLGDLNEALRNINRGRADHLPWYEEIPGLSLVLCSRLEPKGPGKPPAMGRWEVMVRLDGRPYELALRGMIREGSGVGDLTVLCGDAEWEKRARDIALP